MTPSMPTDALRPDGPRLSEEMMGRIDDAADRLPIANNVVDVPSSPETVIEMPAEDRPFARLLIGHQSQVILTRHESRIWATVFGSNRDVRHQLINPDDETRIVGRKYNDVLRSDDHVSHEHLGLRLSRDGILSVRDHESTNGTSLEAIGERPKLEKWLKKLGGKVVSFFESLNPERSHDNLTTAAVAEKPSSGEDRALVNRKKGLFGVLDGAGGEGNAALAAQTGLESVANSSRDKSLAEILKDANKEVLQKANGGKSTATIVRLDHVTGEVEWASVGDSRLYVVSGADGSIRQITTDECLPLKPSVITNCLGKNGMRVEQTGRFPYSNGDRLVIVSDGVTGDYADEKPDPVNLSSAMRDPDPERAAHRLVFEVAKKNDDRTAVVVDLQTAA